MSAISLKSITGITSITTPAGVDNQLTLHTNNTTERVKIDVAGNVHVNNHLSVTGVTTTSDDINIPVTNKKLKIGASQQLQLYNQGFHSRIDHVGNHWLAIRSNALGLFDASDNYFLDGLASTGAVRLYKSNNIKLETTNTGINVTGGAVFTSTDAGSAAEPEVVLYRNSASPADADYLGQIKFNGKSDTGAQRTYAKMTGKILDASNGTEDGIIEFAHIKAGSQNISARFRSDSLQLLNNTNLTVDGDTTLTDLDVDGHTNLDNVSIAGVTTITGSGNALEIVGGLVRSRNTAAARFVANNGSAEGYFGWSSGVLTVGQAAATLSLEATGSNYIQFKTNSSERLRIDSNGRVSLNDNSRPAGDSNEGAQLRVTGAPLTRNQYYSPAGHYYGSFGYTDNTYTKSWIAVDSSYAKSSAVSAGIFLSAFHQDAGGSACGFTIKNLKDGNPLVISSVVTAASVGNPAVETERLRITSGGDILIADTTNSVYNDTSGGGINLKANGQIVTKKQATSAADPLVWLNDTGQTTNKMIVLAQDGSEKGYIGLTNGSRLSLGVNGADKATITQGGLVEATLGFGIANVGGSINGSGGTENWIGIKDSGGNFKFVVKTHSASSGNFGKVGINNTNPTHPLHIVNTSSTYNSASLIKGDTSTSGGGAYATFTNTADSKSAYFGVDGNGLFNVDPGAALVGTNGSEPIIFATGGNDIKVRILGGTDNCLQLDGGSKLSITDYAPNVSFSGSYAGLHHDNHGNTLLALNASLNYSGTSGTHQWKQNNAHPTIGSAGIFIGGNGSNNNSDICFFRNGQGNSSGQVFSQDSWMLRISSIITQNFNTQYMTRGFFYTNTSSQNASNAPALAGTLSYGFGYQEAYSTSGGGWSHPYPDLVLGYHTGVSFGGHNSYGGCRFFTDHPSSSSTMIFSVGNGNNGVAVVNSLSKGGGSFRIAHPHPSKKYTHDLQHSFIEGPQCDNIYRGKIDLVAGSASINIDTVSNMTDGTFVLLNRDIQCFTSNETGWTAVKGSVSGNILTITAQDNSCTDTISWMVIGERQDDKIKSPEMEMTDSDGKLIVEPLTIEESHM